MRNHSVKYLSECCQLNEALNTYGMFKDVKYPYARQYLCYRYGSC